MGRKDLMNPTLPRLGDFTARPLCQAGRAQINLFIDSEEPIFQRHYCQGNFRASTLQCLVEFRWGREV